MSARSAAELYEDDFYAWTQRQAKELRRFARSRPNVPLDLEHIAEEIADLGISQRNALRSHTRRIIEHLLLLEHSRARDPRRGWAEEILNFRGQIEDRLTATLRRDLQRRLPQLHERARKDVEQRLELYGEADRASDLPERCPYTLGQILGDFWPASVKEDTEPR